MTPSPKKYILATCGIVTVIIGLWMISLFFGSGPLTTTTSDRQQSSMYYIASAVKNYQSELNEEPPVEEEQFFDALRGNNPRGIVFLSLPSYNISDSGMITDFWGNPYQVFFGSDGWLIRSSGPDGAFTEYTSRHCDDILMHIPKYK
jgi:hypothetical protein